MPVKEQTCQCEREQTGREGTPLLHLLYMDASRRCDPDESWILAPQMVRLEHGSSSFMYFIFLKNNSSQVYPATWVFIIPVVIELTTQNSQHSCKINPGTE